MHTLRAQRGETLSKITSDEIARRTLAVVGLGAISPRARQDEKEVGVGQGGHEVAAIV